MLHIWRGTYENRIEQGYYDWYVIAGYYDGMRVLGELKDSRETLLSVDGQLQLIDDRAVEDVSTFSFTQEIIDLGTSKWFKIFTREVSYLLLF